MGDDSVAVRAERDRQTRIALLRALAPTHPVFYGLELPDHTGRRISKDRPLWLTQHARRG